MNKKLIIILMFVSIPIIISSCSWMQGKVADDEVKELDSKMKPQTTETSFDEAFFQFGNMLEAYDIPRTPIQSKNIGNETEAKEVPTVIYTMVATAINKIGREIIFIPYDAQYVIDESSTGGKITRVLPEAVLSGGITGFDKELIEKQRSGDVSASFPGIEAGGGASYRAGMDVSRILLDMNMMDYTTQAYYPGVLASNRIYIRKDMLGWSVTASYMDFDVSLESEVKTKQGLYMALRYLVELSTIEVLGKYFNVPYWKCIKGATADKKMMIRLKDNFDSMDSGTQALYLKKYLYLNGYKHIDRNSNKFSSEDQVALQDAMQKYNVKNYPDLFMSLWENVPIAEARKRVLADRKNQVKLAKHEREKAEIEAQKAALEQQNAEQQKARELAEQQKAAAENYNKSISSADLYFKAQNYSEASKQYAIALQLVPDDTYARDQKAAVDKILNGLAAREEGYRQAVETGDSLMTRGEFIQAKSSYEKALSLKPGDDAAGAKINEAEQKIKEKNPYGIKNMSSDDFNKD